MKLVRYFDPAIGQTWGLLEAEDVHPLPVNPNGWAGFLSSLVQMEAGGYDLVRMLRGVASRAAPVPWADLAGAVGAAGCTQLLAPIEQQEVWAAGVTYLRSKVARMEESEGAARFYDLVYDSERPELFLKATPHRVSGPHTPVRIRADARWNVPEPELGLLLSPKMRIIGYTIGNDMSSRDIEGENPLYLPQAKVYSQACGLGPLILLEEDAPEHREFEIRLDIRRGGEVAFHGTTNTSQMKRTFAELASWLGRDNDFPHGAFLLTGTGLVPGDDFTLQPGDRITITVPEIGELTNEVVQGPQA
jgi:2-dehydro-3-deoxy-D-arabinonate dehydratase